MVIEEAILDDAPLILEYIKKKAHFDGDMRGEPCIVTVNLEKIKKTLFGEAPYAQVFFARDVQGQTLGFALYHVRYSSFSGKPSIWLDDLFVDSSGRSKGIGKELMIALEKKGKEINASHLSWNASSNNIRGQEFYTRFGAEIERTEGSALLYRYEIQG